MNSKNILITTASLALISLSFSATAQLYYDSNSAEVIQDSAEELDYSFTSNSDYVVETDSHCGYNFKTTTYFKDLSGTNDRLIVSWDGLATLPSSCVGNNGDMDFDEVEIRVSSRGAHWSTSTTTWGNQSTGSVTLTREWVSGDHVDTHVEYRYLK